MALVAMFVALIVGSGWALAMVPNVELVTALAFTAGATMGPVLGAVTGASGMFLFSATNPVGSGLAFPILLAAQVTSQAAIGLLGGLFAGTDPDKLSRRRYRAVLAASGLGGTILYDGLTSISFPLFAGAGAAEIIALLVSGLAFTILHQVSNTLIFYLLVPRFIQVGRGGQQRRSGSAADDPPGGEPGASSGGEGSLAGWPSGEKPLT